MLNWGRRKRKKVLLKNKEDGFKYRISSENAHGVIRLFAVPCNPEEGKPFVAYYRSLAELNAEWEDID